MTGHETITLPHRHMRECARDMLACIEGALEFEEKMDYMVTEDVLMATAEDCEIARDSCNELLEDIVEIPLGKGPNYYGLGQHMRRGLP